VDVAGGGGSVAVEEPGRAGNPQAVAVKTTSIPTETKNITRFLFIIMLSFRKYGFLETYKIEDND
jgi:hypothetical protein